jgi:hypothetical protein
MALTSYGDRERAKYEGQVYVDPSSGAATEKHKLAIALCWAGFLGGLLVAFSGCAMVGAVALRGIDRYRAAHKIEPRGFPLD